MVAADGCALWRLAGGARFARFPNSRIIRTLVADGIREPVTHSDPVAYLIGPHMHCEADAGAAIPCIELSSRIG